VFFRQERKLKLFADGGENEGDSLSESFHGNLDPYCTVLVFK
jgi:hypothetical protein